MSVKWPSSLPVGGTAGAGAINWISPIGHVATAPVGLSIDENKHALIRHALDGTHFAVILWYKI